MTEIVSILLWIVGGILCFFLVFPFLTIAISTLVRESQPALPGQKTFDFGCIITAYKNLEITAPLIASLLRQHHSNFHIYLVADHCNGQQLDIRDEKLHVLIPVEPLNLKAKSIIYGMDNFVRAHDYTVVFDADNLAHPNFLSVMNGYANLGHKNIQGQRTAKNLDSVYAAMDSLGEFYKNYIERFTTYLLGSSSVISGSGMAVETKLYRAYLESPAIQRGKDLWKRMLQEDKILQNFLLNRGERIVYAREAICYDEKVNDGKAVETQRSRWLFSYFQNLPNSSGILLKGLLGLNWNQLYFGIITITPPLFILVASSLFIAIVSIFIDPVLTIVLMTGMGIFILGVLWSLYLSRVPKMVWRSVLSIPLFIWKQVTALFKMRNPDKYFKHTEHRKKVSIDEVLSEK